MTRDAIRVKTQDPFVSARKVPIPHLLVTATTSGTAQTLLTARTDALTQIGHLAVVNATAAAATLTLHSIPDGGTIGTSNAELVAVSIPANTAANLTDYIGQFYVGGAVLKAYSDTASALVLHGWVEEVL